jgi:hypothetical protein
VFAAEDIDAMTDDECIATAMLLDAWFSVWPKAAMHFCNHAGWFYHADTKAGAARKFLREAHSRA